MGSVKDEIIEYQEEKDNLESKLVDLKNVVNEKQSEVLYILCYLINDLL